MDSRKELEVLLTGRFTESEVERLRIFRREYLEREKQKPLLDQRRLEFIRWLVRQKKLTDELA